MQDTPTRSLQDVDPLILISKLFTKPKYSPLIKKAKVLKCRSAHLYHNDYPQIIKEISHIEFPNLTLLHLSNNRIRSIQALKYLKCPILTNLHISFNDIVHAKSLRKCSFPLLQKISLMGTKIIDVQCFNEFYFPNILSILLENPKQQSDNSCFNVGILVKFYPKFSAKFSMRPGKPSKQIVALLTK